MRACGPVALLFLASACGESTGGRTDTATPWPVTNFPALPAGMTDVPQARIDLGRFLFYDPVLSVDQETSCSTCHSERWGLSDTLERGVGHSAGRLAGPGRRGPNTLRRNSSSLYNLAFRETLLWDRGAATLEEQVLVPLFSDDEMGADPEVILADIAEVPEYVALFEAAFPDDPVISIDNIAAALADYQRTFLSIRATYDLYTEGRPVMTDDMVDGMFRFAEMGCDGCHTPPLFEAEAFFDRAVAPIDGVTDHGLEEVTGRVEDRGKFRAVTLRNIAFTEPYFHNGTVDNLSDAVRHELAQGAMPFTEEDVRLITVFIGKALRDESQGAVRPAHVPSGLPLSIDDPGSR